MGYSIQFISALAFFESVNMGDITSAMQINEKIINAKHNKNKNPFLIYIELLKNILVKITLRNMPFNPKKVLAITFPIIITENLVGLQNRFSRVPIYLSLSISPAEEKQIELHKLVSPLPKTTKFT